MNQFSVLWSSTVSMSFKNITPAWEKSLGRVIHSAALRARARAPRAAIRQPRYLCETAESADTAAIIFELAISATSAWMLPPHTAQRSSRPAAEHVEQSVVDAWWQEGGAEGGPNGTKGGGWRFSNCRTFAKERGKHPLALFP